MFIDYHVKIIIIIEEIPVEWTNQNVDESKEWTFRR